MALNGKPVSARAFSAKLANEYFPGAAPSGTELVAPNGLQRWGQSAYDAGSRSGAGVAHGAHLNNMALGGVGGGALALLHEALRQKSEQEKSQPLGEKLLRYASRGGMGALAGAGAGGLLTAAKSASAREFGEKLANSLLHGGLGGAALGAGLGGLAGALSPGHEETLDDEGNLVKRRKSRLMAALGGALGGGVLGGGAGAALGHFRPEMVNNLSSRAQGLYGLGKHKMLEAFGKAPSRNAASVSPQQMSMVGALG